MAVRFCKYCKQPMQEGHVLYEVYTYCTEECLRKDNKGNEEIEGVSMEEMYEKEIQYWTQWLLDAPQLNIVEVYSVFDTLFFYKEDAELIAENSISEKVKTKWVLLTDAEERELEQLILVTDEGHTKYLEYTHKPFTHSEARTFDTLEQVREAYEEEEEQVA